MAQELLRHDLIGVQNADRQGRCTLSIVLFSDNSMLHLAHVDLANRMAKARNPYFFHMPLRPGIGLPIYAFPFTPAEIPRGQVYEFLLNHVVHTKDGRHVRSKNAGRVAAVKDASQIFT